MTFKNAHPNFVQNAIKPDVKHRYECLSEKYINKTVDLFTYAFCRSEPMTQYLKMDEEKYKIFARAVVEKAVVDRLSIIALEDEKVIACALVEDLASPGEIPDFDPKFKYILGLLEKLGEPFFKDKVFPKQLIAHLFITAVDANYRHQGLSTQVNFQAMDLAAKHHFNFIYCEFTHYFNELGILHHLKNPHKLIGSEIYQDFVFEGEKPFKNLQGGANSYLWAIQKEAKLIYTRNNKVLTEQL